MLVLEKKMERHRAGKRAKNLGEVKLLLHIAVLVQAELRCLSSFRLKYHVTVSVVRQLLSVCSE